MKFQCTEQLRTNQETSLHGLQHESMKMQGVTLSQCQPDASWSATPHFYMFTPSVTRELSLINKQHQAPKFKENTMGEKIPLLSVLLQLWMEFPQFFYQEITMFFGSMV